ncbi:MAG: NPCBM/NEW2 domain-containing protein [Chitinophagaceae bacterium]
MSKITTYLFYVLLFVTISMHAQQTNSIYLSDLPLHDFESGMVMPKANIAYVNSPLKVAGKTYSKGIGARPISALFFYLGGKALHFSGMAAHDDAGRSDTHIQFYILADGKIIWQSKPMLAGEASDKFDLDLNGVQKLGLLLIKTEDVPFVASGDWLEPLIIMQDGYKPEKVANPINQYILTPKEEVQPKITSAKVFGVGPGHPFLYNISATGTRPMQFAATELPDGLSIDKQTGIITGRIVKAGDYVVQLLAKNKYGETKKTLTIKCGAAICLTPTIGWNGFNAWGHYITQDIVLRSAKVIVASGLINHGWNYINIDDTWEGQRGGVLNAIQPNEKFPNMQALMDSLHAMGFKTGIYSTPWIATYAGYTGSTSDYEDGHLSDTSRDMPNKRSIHYIGKYHFEENDAKQWAKWGIDYMKYDWRMDTASAQRMSTALKNSGRDIAFSLSNNAPFEYADVWANVSNCWRTGADIRDSWLSVLNAGFTINKWQPFAGPGHWNDPDMLVVGDISTGKPLSPTRLTADEQYTHISQWSLLAAPLLIGCTIENLDSFTMNLLTNDEVIAIDQDPLGIAAKQMLNKDGMQVWARPLQDGSYAVGLFNTGNSVESPASYFTWGNEKPKELNFNFEIAGLKGKWQLRDLWRQKDLGTFNGSFNATIPFHGVLLLRMMPIKKNKP